MYIDFRTYTEVYHGAFLSLGLVTHVCKQLCFNCPRSRMLLRCYRFIRIDLFENHVLDNNGSWVVRCTCRFGIVVCTSALRLLLTDFSWSVSVQVVQWKSLQTTNVNCRFCYFGAFVFQLQLLGSHCTPMLRLLFVHFRVPGLGEGWVGRSWVLLSILFFLMKTCRFGVSCARGATSCYVTCCGSMPSSWLLYNYGPNATTLESRI